MQIVEPVVLRPLKAEWEAARATIEAALQEEWEAKAEAARTRAAAKSGAQTRAREPRARDGREGAFGLFERGRAVRVLDPACGSGNFLNLALKNLEHRVNLDAEALGLPALTLRQVVPLALPDAECTRTALEIEIDDHNQGTR